MQRVLLLLLPVSSFMPIFSECSAERHLRRKPEEQVQRPSSIPHVPGGTRACHNMPLPFPNAAVVIVKHPQR